MNASQLIGEVMRHCGVPQETISDVIVTLCILHKLDTNPVWVFHPDGEHRSTSCEIDVDSALQADGRMAVRLYVS